MQEQYLVKRRGLEVPAESQLLLQGELSLGAPLLHGHGHGCCLRSLLQLRLELSLVLLLLLLRCKALQLSAMH